MAAGTALAKIRARVKALRKKNPKAKFRTLQKQAGSEYRAGKLKTRRKRTVAGVAKVKRRKARRKSPVKRKARVITRTRTRIITKYRTRRVKVRAKRRRTVSGIGKIKTSTILIVGGLILGAVFLFGGKRTTVQYVPTGNVTRDNTAQTILAAAQAAGATADAIARLIKQINQSNDSQLPQIYDNVKNYGPAAIPGDIAGFNYN